MKETTIGDFLTWATRSDSCYTWIRGFESIRRVDNEIAHGWGYTYCTMIGFVSDEDINKEVPEKTAEEWEAWGR